MNDVHVILVGVAFAIVAAALLHGVLDRGEDDR